MIKFENFNKTIRDLYVEKDGDKKINELCNSIKLLKGKYDKAIIVLTGELRRVEFSDGDSKIKSDFAPHMREAAAALQYNKFRTDGFRPVIIASGGKMYGNKESDPVLSEIMKMELIKKYGISGDDILTEPYSIDTSQNARFCSEILKTLGFLDLRDKSSCLITSQFHLERSSLLFEKYFDKKIELMDAEGILVQMVKKNSNDESRLPYKKVIEKYLNSEANLNSVQMDEKLRMITKVPAGEKLLEAVAYYIRATGEGMNIPIINKDKK